jgi:hypothetical protein
LVFTNPLLNEDMKRELTKEMCRLITTGHEKSAQSEAVSRKSAGQL